MENCQIIRPKSLVLPFHQISLSQKIAKNAARFFLLLPLKSSSPCPLPRSLFSCLCSQLVSRQKGKWLGSFGIFLLFPLLQDWGPSGPGCLSNYLIPSNLLFLFLFIGLLQLFSVEVLVCSELLHLRWTWTLPIILNALLW